MTERHRILLRKMLPFWKLAFELLLIAAFVFYGIRHWEDMRTVVQRISPSTLCLSIGIYTCSHFLAAAMAQLLFSANGYPLHYATFLRIHLQRLPAKYLPGGIWQSIGRGADLVGIGIPTRTVIQTLLVEQLLAIWWAGFLGFLLAGLAFNGKVPIAAIAAACALLAGGIVATVLARMFKPDLVRLINAARSSRVCAVYVIGWSLLASAFTCYLWLGGLTQAGPLRIASSYLVSWMLGAMAFFAPQGMGVFELAMQYAIFPLQNKAEALWLIGSYRPVVLVADMLAWLASWHWRRMASSSNGIS
ncbi:hypothetical protein [Pseudoxanthomonas sacheonensis]|nr:hypothetical protein [Pseudoxanthomonas sacheonensis]